MSSIQRVTIGQAAQVALGPFYGPDGVTEAHAIPENIELSILGTDEARGMPTRIDIQPARPPVAIDDRPGYFIFDLGPSATEGLKGIATVASGEAAYAILWLVRAAAAPTPE